MSEGRPQVYVVPKKLLLELDATFDAIEDSSGVELVLLSEVCGVLYGTDRNYGHGFLCDRPQGHEFGHWGPPV